MKKLLLMAYLALAATGGGQTKISDLTPLPGSGAAAGDVLPIVDTSAGAEGSKKITLAELFATPVPWNGVAISGAKGGTGVDNSGKTITLGGNLTTSGSFPTTLTVTGSTNVTLPTTGTLATTAGIAAKADDDLSNVDPTTGRAVLGLQAAANGNYLFYDLMAAQPDGDLHGRTAASGGVWNDYTTVEAATNTVVTRGVATADDWFERGPVSTASYATTPNLGQVPRRIGGVVSFGEGNGGINAGEAVFIIGSAVGVFDSCVHCKLKRGSAILEIENPVGGSLGFHTLDSKTFGLRQVETASAVGAISGSGNLSVVVTGALLPNLTKTLSVAVVNGDATSTWAGKVRAALLADAVIPREYQVGGTGDNITLSPWYALYENDATLNIAISEGTATGITPVTTSVNTTAGSRVWDYGEQIAVEVEFNPGSDSMTMRLASVSRPGQVIELSGTHADVSEVGGNHAAWECFGYGPNVSGESPKMADIARFHAMWTASDAIKANPLDALSEINRLAYPAQPSLELLAGLSPFWQRVLAASTEDEALEALGLKDAVRGDQRRNYLRPGRQLIVGGYGHNEDDSGILFSNNNAPEMPRLRMTGDASSFRLQRLDANGKRTLGSFMLEMQDSNPAGSILMKNGTGYFPLVPTAGPGVSFSTIAPGQGFGTALRYSAIPSSVTALTDAATIAMDAALNTDYSCQLTSVVGATRTLGTPTNPAAGQRIRIRFRQPASGGPCDITLSSGWAVGPHTIALSTGANVSDYIEAVYNGPNSKWDIIGFVKGY